MNDFINRLEEHENGTAELKAQELAWYNDFVDGVRAKGELVLKKELNEFYAEHTQSRSAKVIRMWSAVGIAAILAIGGFYFSTINSSSDPIQLQTNDSPIYSDSATYDTAENKVEKKSENDVDK